MADAISVAPYAALHCGPPHPLASAPPAGERGNLVGAVVPCAKRTAPPQQIQARMLDKVEKFWIKDVLEQSLYQIARLDLGLEQALEKIDHPWATIVQQAAASHAVPAGTPTIRLFDDLDGKLLILGAPGSGKTTLLELARDLIDRARNDPKALR